MANDVIAEFKVSTRVARKKEKHCTSVEPSPATAFQFVEQVANRWRKCEKTNLGSVFRVIRSEWKVVESVTLDSAHITSCTASSKTSLEAAEYAAIPVAGERCVESCRENVRAAVLFAVEQPSAQLHLGVLVASAQWHTS